MINNILIYITIIALSLASCTKSPKSYKLTELKKLKFGQKATLMGVYTKNIIAQKPPGEHIGLYKIVVNDTRQWRKRLRLCPA